MAELMSDVAAARWGIAYHANSPGRHAKRWYRVARMVFADGGWFELYWHASTELRGNSHMDVRRKAVAQGLDPLPGLFSSCIPPRRGGEMERKL